MTEGDSSSGRGGGHFHDAQLPEVSLLELLDSLSDFLCALSRQRGRDRWWFLQGRRFTEAKTFVGPLGNVWTEPRRDRKTQIVGNRTLFRSATPSLFALVRVHWNAGQAKSTALVEFAASAPGMDARCSAAIGARRRLTVEVRFGQQTRQAGIFTKRAIRGLSLAQRQELWRQYLRWQRSKDGNRELLRVDLRWDGSRTETIFSFLLYLWRHDMIDLGPETEPEAWKFAKDVLSRWRVKDDQGAFEVLSALKGGAPPVEPSPAEKAVARAARRYAFPERPAALFKYIKRVVKTLHRGERSRELVVGPEEIERIAESRARHRVENETGEDERLGGIEHAQPGPVWRVAERLGRRPETVYRWIKSGKLPETRKKTAGRGQATLWLNAEALKIATCRVQETTIRKRIREYLLQRGATPAAAKKRIQRWLATGGTLEGLAESMPEDGGREVV